MSITLIGSKRRAQFQPDRLTFTHDYIQIPLQIKLSVAAAGLGLSAGRSFWHVRVSSSDPAANLKCYRWPGHFQKQCRAFCIRSHRSAPLNACQTRSSRLRSRARENLFAFAIVSGELINQSANLGSDLIATLTGLQMNDFSHGWWLLLLLFYVVAVACCETGANDAATQARRAGSMLLVSSAVQPSQLQFWRSSTAPGAAVSRTAALLLIRSDARMRSCQCKQFNACQRYTENSVSDSK